MAFLLLRALDTFRTSDKNYLNLKWALNAKSVGAFAVLSSIANAEFETFNSLKKAGETQTTFCTEDRIF